MSLGRYLDGLLDDKLGHDGEIGAEKGGAKAVVDVADVDRLGVRVRRLKVSRSQARDVGAEAKSLPDRLRTLPDKVAPVEVDERLGGATLRSEPEQMRGREFFEVEVRGERDVEVRRYRARADDYEAVLRDARWLDSGRE